MPMQGPRHPFTAKDVAAAPKEPGVFVLWDGQEAIYIGRTAGVHTTIQAALADHSLGAYGDCTQFATHYSFEATTLPAPREQELMEGFGRLHGRLPRCQNVVRRRR